MSREELIELICPFENHLKCKDDEYSISCDECKAELDTLLDEYDAKVRADAIDEFLKAMEKHEQDNWIDNLEYGITFADLEEVAEQLKEKNP